MLPFSFVSLTLPQKINKNNKKETSINLEETETMLNNTTRKHKDTTNKMSGISLTHKLYGGKKRENLYSKSNLRDTVSNFAFIDFI